MVELAQSQARDLQPVHCRAICHEIGERLRLALDQDRLPLPSRLRDVLDRFEEGGAPSFFDPSQGFAEIASEWSIALATAGIQHG